MYHFGKAVICTKDRIENEVTLTVLENGSDKLSRMKSSDTREGAQRRGNRSHLLN